MWGNGSAITSSRVTLCRMPLISQGLRSVDAHHLPVVNVHREAAGTVSTMDPLTTFRSLPRPLSALLACAALGMGPFHATQKDRGINVELSVRAAAEATSPLREAETARFTVTLSDETTGAKLAGVY